MRYTIIRLVPICLFSVATATVGLAQEPEILYFKNGDRFPYGSNHGAADGLLLWELPYGKRFLTPLEMIERVESGSQKLPTEPKCGDLKVARKSTSMGDNQVKTAIHEELESRAKQLNIVQVSCLVFSRMCMDTFSCAKRLELGGQFLNGNSDSDFISVNSYFKKQWDNRFLDVDVGGQYGQSNGDQVTNRWFSNATIDFNHTGKWIRYIISKNEYSQFENLDYRGTVSGGVGYRFYTEKKKYLIVRFGPAVTHEFFRQPTVQRTTADLFAELNSRWSLFDGVQFENAMTFRPSINELDVFRLSSQTALLFHLDKHDRWNLKLGLVVRHNSRPNNDRSRTDYTSNISLVYIRD